ncbi:MAG: transglutaminase family protein, partial [Planctomycetota bacterium]
MSLRIAIYHETRYAYSRPIELGPQVIRLRPAPHCRTPIRSYSLDVEPREHFLNWQQDPYGNYLARVVVPKPCQEFRVTTNLIAEMVAINPFDFFLEEAAEQFPFAYDADLARDLAPYREVEPMGAKLAAYVSQIDRCTPRRTIDFLVEVNRLVQQDIQYLVRMEPGVQNCERTLTLRSGSCRDSAWLLVQILRHLGFAVRFVSGYLAQLVADVKPIDGPEGPSADFTDLHAWVEVYLPGGGWVGLDPTSGLFAGEGHIPLAATPQPQSAAPVTGGVEPCDVDFSHSMRIERVEESPRVSKPFTTEQWESIRKLGDRVDERLDAGDVRLTMGGEPTFVSIDDMEGEEWTVGAVGADKRKKSIDLSKRMRDRFASGGLLHYGQGKWYPGESLPRWADTCVWRRDGEPVWKNPSLLSDPSEQGSADRADAKAFVEGCARRLGIESDWVRPAYEDPWDVIARERRLPVDIDVADLDPDSPAERSRLSRTIDRGLGEAVGYFLPLSKGWGKASADWLSGPWVLRTEQLFLIPGDSPLGLRLPVSSLRSDAGKGPFRLEAVDPTAARESFPLGHDLRQQIARR